MLIYPYMVGSRSVKALKDTLGIRIIKREASKLQGDKGKVVINWGNSELPPEIMKCRVINAPEAVLRATHKLRFFQAMEGTRLTPPFCTGSGAALNAMSEMGDIVCRHKLQGHSGEGIEIWHMKKGSNQDPIPSAPLYVSYIKKSEEFRCHVFQGKVVDIQRKARRKDVPDDEVNWQVRNHSNGFVYAREGVEKWYRSSGLVEAATRTIKTLGLDFGAVDIIWNEKQDKFYVLEVNTAPGLEGHTVQVYSEAFSKF